MSHFDFEKNAHYDRDLIWLMGLLVDICIEINAALPILEILFFNFIMMTSSNETKKIPALLAICPGNSPVTDEFPALRSVTRIFDIFFFLCPNIRLSKQ